MPADARKSAPPCPCGLPASLAECCGRYHDGAAAPTAEALMRSRYSAYVLEIGDYLLATWHPSTRPERIDFDPPTRWLGLETRRHSQKKSGNATLAAVDACGDAAAAIAANTATSARQDTVEFVARYKIGGRAYRLHETSRFVHEDGRWFYLDGEIHR